MSRASQELHLCTVTHNLTQHVDASLSDANELRVNLRVLWRTGGGGQKSFLSLSRPQFHLTNK